MNPVFHRVNLDELTSLTIDKMDQSFQESNVDHMSLTMTCVEMVSFCRNEMRQDLIDEIITALNRTSAKSLRMLVSSMFYLEYGKHGPLELKADIYVSSKYHIYSDEGMIVMETPEHQMTTYMGQVMDPMMIPVMG